MLFDKLFLLNIIVVFLLPTFLEYGLKKYYYDGNMSMYGILLELYINRNIFYLILIINIFTIYYKYYILALILFTFGFLNFSFRVNKMERFLVKDKHIKVL